MKSSAKILLFDSLIKYYEMKYITQYSTRNKNIE